MNSERKKAELGAKTLHHFFSQFGNDVYSVILLEELFEGLINAETLFVFGEQEQEGNQTGDCAPEQGDGELPGDGPERTESTEHLGETDNPDYP